MLPESGVASLLWIEGVDFDQTLYDTNQLSVVRGASLTLLAIGKKAEEILKPKGADKGAELIFSGASQALFRLPCDEQAAGMHLKALLATLHEPATGGAPFHHMQWVGGVAFDDGTAKAPRLAQGRARLMQMNGTAPRRPVAATAHQACAFSPHQPADTEQWFSSSQAEKYGVTGRKEDNGRKVPLSAASKARYLYGRTQRQKFYTEERGDGGKTAFAKVLPQSFAFTENLQDMVDLKDSENGKKLRAALPVSLHNKVAIFYADGNGFGALRDKMGGTGAAIKTFSEALKPIMADASAAVLGVVTAGIREGAASPHFAASVFLDTEEKNPDRHQQIRFETLLYGGDEVCFVAPSWFGLAMSQAFFSAVKGKKIDGEPISFKAGLIFAPAKMAISVGQNLVKSLADDGKTSGNSLSIHAFESVDPPKDSISGLRQRLLGFESAKDMIAHEGGKLFVLDGDNLDALIGKLENLTGDEGIPRSQLYRVLQQGLWMEKSEGKKTLSLLDNPRKLNDDIANGMSAETFIKYIGRSPNETSGFWRDELESEKTAALAAYAVTQLWDYVDPVARAKVHAGA